MYLKNFIYGLIIGIGFIIPGVSGGVLATILGIYNTILDKLLNLFKDFKNNFLFLLPILSGIIISILLFSNLILYLLKNKYYFISYVFIGLILGCVPYLFCEIKEKSHKNINPFYFTVSFIFGIILYFIENSNHTVINAPNIPIMIIAGLFYAIGKIVPGISGAALLMFLGVYEYFLNIISNPFSISLNTIITFIPFIISFILSAIIILKLINHLLNNHFRNTYSAIIGFIISSIIFIYPNYISISSIIIMILSFNISYHLSK